MRPNIFAVLLALILILPAFSFAQIIQQPATWGISRVSHMAYQYPLSDVYEYNATGLGVSVYIIDTGILVSHPDFGGRASNVFDVNKGHQPPFETCSGHGTHIAGTVGSTTYGIAKSVKIYSVRVYACDGSSTEANVISGINWVRQHGKHPGVAVLSFSGGSSPTLDNAVQALIDSGITVVVAAGNYGISGTGNACDYSPSRVPAAITVGSTDQRDYRDGISNSGPCVDLYAPGVIIDSTWINGGDTIISGTSTAAPHVAGIAALYLETHPLATPAEVQSAIRSNATLQADLSLFAYSIL